MLVQPQKVLGICLAAGLGEGLSAAPSRSSSRGVEMGPLDAPAMVWSKERPGLMSRNLQRRWPRAGEADHRPVQTHGAAPLERG